MVSWNGTNGAVDITDIPGHGTSLAFRPGANFELRSSKTEMVVTMYYQRQLTYDGEVVGWIYNGATYDYYNKATDITVIVVND